MIALASGALLSLVYALWAFTARRGIFADFEAGRTVNAGDAKMSDNVDGVLVVVAGTVALIAIVVWLTWRARNTTSASMLELVGLALTVIGAATVAIGLFLVATITRAHDQAAQGDRGVTASLVVGTGFVILALGLLAGLAEIRGSAAPGRSQAPSQGVGQGPRGW